MRKLLRGALMMLRSAAAFVLGVMLMAGAVALHEKFTPEPPSVEANAAVLRRLELRLSDPLDRTHPAAGGERYRLFECREVPR